MVPRLLRLEIRAERPIGQAAHNFEPGAETAKIWLDWQLGSQHILDAFTNAAEEFDDQYAG